MGTTKTKEPSPCLTVGRIAMRPSTYKAFILLIAGILLVHFLTLKNPTVQLSYVTGEAERTLTEQLRSGERALHDYLEGFYVRGHVVSHRYTEALIELEASQKLIRVLLDDLALDLREASGDEGVVKSRAMFLYNALEGICFNLPIPGVDYGRDELEGQIALLQDAYEYLFGEYQGPMFIDDGTRYTLAEIIDKSCSPEWSNMENELRKF